MSELASDFGSKRTSSVSKKYSIIFNGNKKKEKN